MQALHKQAQRNQASNCGKAAKSSPNPARSGPPSALPFGFNGGAGVPPVRPSPQPGLQPAAASVISLKPGSSVVEPFSPEAVTAAVTTTPTSADSTKSEVTALQYYSIRCLSVFRIHMGLYWFGSPGSRYAIRIRQPLNRQK